MATDRCAFDLKAYVSSRADLVNAALEQFLPRQMLGGLAEMMRYAMFPGGKRFRPVLTLATAEALGHPPSRVLPAACAWELVHGFSLVHDDLPCMDNDDVRRGKPTCHKQYGEAEALLAGDALVIDAFRLVAFNSSLPDVAAAAVLRVVEELAEAAGHAGMVGGQMLDIHGMQREAIGGDEVRDIHRAKTGALIRGAVRAGAILCNATEAQLSDLTTYSEQLGLVFQITDDLLDYEEKYEIASYPAVFGVEESKRLAAQATQEALSHIEYFGSPAEPLRELARYLLQRNE